MAIGTPVLGTRSNVAGNVGSGSTAPGIPAGIPTNGLMVLVDVVMQIAGAVPTPTTPGGWTQKLTFAQATTARSRLTIMWKRYAADAAPTVAVTGINAAGRHISLIFYLPGAILTGDPFHAIGSGDSFAAVTTALGAITGQATPAGGAVLVAGVHEDCSTTDATTAAVLTGDSLTWVEQEELSEPGTDDMFWVIDSALTPSAITVTNKTFTLVTVGAVAPGSAAAIGVMCSVKPEPAATGRAPSFPAQNGGFF